jgi:diguanylate cyclase (GGDEF)-like protein
MKLLKKESELTLTSEELAACLEFFSTHEMWEAPEEFYRDLNEFLNSHWEKSSCHVFSYPKNEKNSSPRNKMLRKVWKREKGEKKKIEMERWSSMILPQLGKESLKNEGEEIRKNDNLFRLFHVGEEDKQSFIMAIQTDTKNTLSVSMFDSLIKFCRHTYAHMQKWNVMRKRLSLAYIDDVSGLFNQRKLFEDLEESVRKHKSLGEQFALFFLDIDHFKQINDGHGHLVGTSIIAQLGKGLKRYLRETDLVYRYGGDEFVMILSDANLDEARRVGERVLADIHQEAFVLETGNQVNISVSIGIATFPNDAKDTTEILRMADRMMYEAKERGRGQVCLAADILQKKA